MALKTNFTDDILAESMNGKRQYNVTDNSNGTKSLEDVTDYQSVGSTFAAKDMNETNAAVNQAYEDMGDEFNPEVDYAVGDYAIRNNKVWKFTTAHPAGAWDESHVKATKILSEARELTEKIPLDVSDVFSEHSNIESFSGYRIGKMVVVNRVGLTSKTYSQNIAAATLKSNLLPEGTIRVCSITSGDNAPGIVFFNNISGEMFFSIKKSGQTLLCQFVLYDSE